MQMWQCWASCCLDRLAKVVERKWHIFFPLWILFPCPRNSTTWLLSFPAGLDWPLSVTSALGSSLWTELFFVVTNCSCWCEAVVVKNVVLGVTHQSGTCGEAFWHDFAALWQVKPQRLPEESPLHCKLTKGALHANGVWWMTEVELIQWAGWFRCSAWAIQMEPTKMLNPCKIPNFTSMKIFLDLHMIQILNDQLAKFV